MICQVRGVYLDRFEENVGLANLLKAAFLLIFPALTMYKTWKTGNTRRDSPTTRAKSQVLGDICFDPYGIVMSDIFISYKREDQATARQLANALETEGWTIWWDPKLRAGEHFDDVIEKALSDVIVMGLIARSNPDM